MINRGGKYGKVVTAHTLAWEVANGNPVPTGMSVCHRCDHPPCCNPRHLFLGTNQDNIDDKVAKDRQLKGEAVGTSKLNEHEVRAIRSDTGSDREVAARYGVSHRTIQSIRSGATWKHVA
jgi:hypothetical protein